MSFDSDPVIKSLETWIAEHHPAARVAGRVFLANLGIWVFRAKVGDGPSLRFAIDVADLNSIRGLSRTDYKRICQADHGRRLRRSRQRGQSTSPVT